MFEFLKRKVSEEEKLIDGEIKSILMSLRSYSPDTEDYRKALGSLESLVAQKKEICVNSGIPLIEGFKKITGRVFESVTDPRVIGAGLTSIVYIWWGRTCMKYDEDGHIPPSRMLGNGPKAPKQNF